MVLLKQEPFITVKGEPFRFYSDVRGNGSSPYKELSVAEFLLMVLDNFQPTPQLGMILNMGEIRHLNEAASILESDPKDDHYELTQDQLVVVKKVVDWWIPLMSSGFMRNGPALVDYLEAVQ